MRDDVATTPISPDHTETLCHPTEPGVITWLAWRRFSARLERALDAPLRAHGLNQGLLSALLAIGGNEGLTQQELADRLELTKANVSQIVGRLLAMNLVVRRPVARAYALSLTEESRELLVRVVPEQRRLIDEQFQSLSSKEQDLLRDLMLTLSPDPA